MKYIPTINFNSDLSDDIKYYIQLFNMRPHLFKLLILLTIAALAMYFLKLNYRKMVNRFLTTSFKFSSGEFERDLLYRIYKPAIKSDTKYPLVIVLHSAAERGNDNLKQIDDIASLFMSRKTQKKNPAFVLIPQCPRGSQWVNTGFTKKPFQHYQQSLIPESPEMKMIIAVIKQLIAQHPIDTSKVYVGGFSMGSSGTWDIISRYPQIFTAAFLMSGVSDTSVTEKIRHIPVWAFHGELDDIAPVSLNIDMCAAILQHGGTCKLTTYTNVGHYCVHQALKEPGFIEWVFSKQKK
jgi:predicted peptidase